jgi:hypothetical protein
VAGSLVSYCEKLLVAVATSSSGWAAESFNLLLGVISVLITGCKRSEATLMRC